MDAAVLADPIMDRLRRQFPTYHDTAYVFVLAGLLAWGASARTDCGVAFCSRRRGCRRAMAGASP